MTNNNIPNDIPQAELKPVAEKPGDDSESPAPNSSSGNNQLMVREIEEQKDRLTAISKKLGNKNALSHGLYSKDVILPWESQHDFEKLHNGFRDEWNPNGCSEEQAVFELTQYTWFKRRIIKSAQLKFIQTTASQELTLGTASWDEIVRHQTDLPKQALGAVMEVRNLIEGLNGVLDTIRSRHYWTSDSEGKDIQYQLGVLQRDVTSLIQTTEKDVVQGVDSLVGVIKESRRRFEQAYQPEEIDKQLGLLAKVDLRIEKILRRLAHIKTFKRIEPTTSSPPTPPSHVSPPLTPPEISAEEAPTTLDINSETGNSDS